MNIATPAALAAIPARLSALLQGLPDPAIDAEVQWALEEFGLYDDLEDGEAKQTALHFYRIALLSEELTQLADDQRAEADGSTAEERRIAALSDEERAEHERQHGSRAKLAAFFAELSAHPT